MTKRGGARYVVRVKVAGLSGDHVKRARVCQRQRARGDGGGEGGARGADLVATGLRATESDVRHLLVRLQEPVSVRSVCAQSGPL